LVFIWLDPPQAEPVGMLRAAPLNPRKTGGGSGLCLPLVSHSVMCHIRAIRQLWVLLKKRCNLSLIL
jgi:hypothetical protein